MGAQIVETSTLSNMPPPNIPANHTHHLKDAVWPQTTSPDCLLILYRYTTAAAAAAATLLVAAPPPHGLAQL